MNFIFSSSWELIHAVLLILLEHSMKLEVIQNFYMAISLAYKAVSEVFHFGNFARSKPILETGKQSLIVFKLTYYGKK